MLASCSFRVEYSSRECAEELELFILASAWNFLRQLKKESGAYTL